MKIDPSRYETEIDRVVAAGASDLIVRMTPGSIHSENGVFLADKANLESNNRIVFSGEVEFPKKLSGMTINAQIKGNKELIIWSDIDPDEVGIGSLTWWEDDLLYLAASSNIEFVNHLSQVAGSERVETIRVTANIVGLESVEFMNNEIPKGVVVKFLKASFKT
jgi:hypothetical protein